MFSVFPFIQSTVCIFKLFFLYVLYLWFSSFLCVLLHWLLTQFLFLYFLNPFFEHHFYVYFYPVHCFYLFLVFPWCCCFLNCLPVSAFIKLSSLFFTSFLSVVYYAVFLICFFGLCISSLSIFLVFSFINLIILLSFRKIRTFIHSCFYFESFPVCHGMHSFLNFVSLSDFI